MAHRESRRAALAPPGEHLQETAGQNRAADRIDRVVKGRARAGFQEMFQDLLRAS